MIIVLDRDGVINEDSPNFIKAPEEWHAINGSLEAIAKLNKAGFIVVIATNQSGIGRGLLSLEILQKIHAKMNRELAKHNGHIDDIFFCPHLPEDNCYCRKPKNGLLLEIAEKFNVKPQELLVVGDSWRDIETARNTNCQSVLVKTGNGEKTIAKHGIDALSDCKIFANLSAFVDDLLLTTENIPQRHIKSFVKRSRQLTAKRQHIFTTLSNKYLLQTDLPILNISDIFPQSPNNDNILEIGFGMGDYLWHMINHKPNCNFIGIEVHQPGVAKLLEKLYEHPYENIRIYNADAIDVLNKALPNESFSQILLLFPDPWQKRRQAKRRIVQENFIKIIQRKLVHNGEFFMATDCKDYAEHVYKTITNSLSSSSVSVIFESHQANAVIEQLPTKFAKRAINGSGMIYIVKMLNLQIMENKE